MKKILFVCEGDNFSDSAIHFIKLMNENEPVLVKGLFFTPIDFQELVSVSYIPIAKSYVKLKEEEKQIVLRSRNKFISICESANIRYHVNENDELDNDLLIKETRFADAMIISE